MEIENLGTKGNWREAANAARTTISMKEGGGEPSNNWKKQMLLAEHSPIRKLQFMWKWIDIPYCYSVHFVRHKFGIEHFVSTQRDDRTGENRVDKSQKAPIIHECEANAQAIINISRKRLCGQASAETQYYWRQFLEKVVAVNDPELYEVCVEECLYRGFCPEKKTCGYADTDEYQERLKEYRKIER